MQSEIFVRDLVDNPPLLHAKGEKIYGLDHRVLRYLASTLPTGCRSLETGLGLSTAIFANFSAEHTVIVPSQDQIDRFRAYCSSVDLDIRHVEFICDFSQNVLPTLKREALDIVLIDGGHGYPIPALDWFFTAPMLKLGGRAIVDDTQISTGDELVCFLRQEPDWKLVERFCRTEVFERTGDGHAKEFSAQPHVVARSRVLRLRQRHTVTHISAPPDKAGLDTERQSW